MNYLNASRSHSWFVLLFVLFAITTAKAQIPSGYYDDAVGKTGSNLKSSLNGIISGHTTYPYTSSNTDVWDILKVADKDPGNASNVIGIYSGFSMDGAAEYASGSGWSREHVWAKSRGNFGTSQGAGTDCHHIVAEDISTNSARNNRNFDYGDSFYTDGSGTYNGATLSKTSSDWIWEPRDSKKGDVARMIFYMATRYEGAGSEPDLELSEILLSSSDTSPVHGKLSVLLSWHLSDPVSAEEQARNEVIYSYQNNRNPFIDHPEWVETLYAAECEEAEVVMPTVSVDGVDVNEGTDVALTAQVNVDGLTFEWTQESGVMVELTNADSATVNFTAPAVDKAETIVLLVTVTDPFGNKASSTVEVNVADIPAPIVVVEEPKEKSSSGGSFGFYILALMSLLSFRTRRS